ncbi:Protein TOO MANY MOUTHS like [Actinidia chinensis var. chinensis]|uniref:Protein TOO MANY MOUTHS like n=1 Tax=Actinidia chinensis var. chinensis TaxID=1590841 RepID=A0A2R6QZQ3_ACTCC|nr:Protein TOO MANY MOUTHS like [Actinidia chinensis var. chinensis]
MDLFLSLQKIVLLGLMCFPMATPFTVIMSDSSAPSTLVDAPQTGFSNINGAKTDAREQEAVYDIMRATGNPWATDINDVCRGRWHGIECMPDEDNVYHVVSLSFGALSDDTAFPTCDLSRSFISPSITKLPHLRTLFFYRCFSDSPQPIPTFLGQLGSTLQTLVLRENGHVGPIPNELGNLTGLKVLDLHKNNLNGSIPISLNRAHQSKILGFERQQTNRSDSFSLLPCFEYFRPKPKSPCGFNAVNPWKLPIPHKSNPMESTTIPSDGFDGLKELMILDLSDMNLHGPIPESLGHLTNLRVLHLDGNYLNGSIPPNFRDLNNLSELRLNNNWLTGPVPFRREMVWRMKRKLRLYNNSGLCFDARNGFEDGFDSFFDSGIGHCEARKPGLSRSVQHLSTANEDMARSLNKSSGEVQKVSLLSRLIQLTSILVFVMCLL